MCLCYYLFHPNYDTRSLRMELQLPFTDKSLVNEHVIALKNYYGPTQLTQPHETKTQIEEGDTKEPIPPIRRIGRLLYITLCPLLPSQAITVTSEDKC